MQFDEEMEVGRPLFYSSAPSEEAILKITYPFKDIGVPHIAPALPLEEALEMMEKM